MYTPLQLHNMEVLGYGKVRESLTLTPSHSPPRAPRFVSAKDRTNEGKSAPLLVFVLSTQARRAIGVLRLPFWVGTALDFMLGPTNSLLAASLSECVESLTARTHNCAYPHQRVGRCMPKSSRRVAHANIRGGQRHQSYQACNVSRVETADESLCE